jgi:hypothetical protein
MDRICQRVRRSSRAPFLRPCSRAAPPARSRSSSRHRPVRLHFARAPWTSDTTSITMKRSRHSERRSRSTRPTRAVSARRRDAVDQPAVPPTAAKMPSGRWYSDGSFHGPVPMMAPHGTREGWAVRRAHVIGPAAHRAGVRFGNPSPQASAVSVRDRRTARRCRQGALLLEGDAVRRLRSPGSGRTSHTCTTAACRPCTTCSDRFPSDPISSR